MKLYKLTDANGQTRNGTQWGENVTHTAKGNPSKPLCSDAWIHAYTDPILAVFMAPIHVDFVNPQMWEAVGSGQNKSDSTKVGYQTITTIKQRPIPTITTTQRVAFGILAAKQVFKGAYWNKWADNWLANINRTAIDTIGTTSTAAANAAAVNAAANANAAAVNTAATSAVNATNAAANAANAASAAAYAANAAYAAAYAANIDLVTIAHEAMEY